MTFSKKSRNPPTVKSRNAQLTKPVKLSNPEDQENKESRGLCILKKKIYNQLYTTYV